MCVGGGGGAFLSSKSGSAGRSVGRSQEEGDRASCLHPKDSVGSEGEERTMLVGWRTWAHALALRAFVREAPPSMGRSRAREQLFPQADFSSHQERTFQCAEPLGWAAHNGWCEQDSGGRAQSLRTAGPPQASPSTEPPPLPPQEAPWERSCGGTQREPCSAPSMMLTPDPGADIRGTAEGQQRKGPCLGELGGTPH